MEKIITVFGSGFTQRDEELYLETVNIGRTIAENSFTVCCGGYGGTMEAVCKGAKSVGGKTIGITVKSWESKPNDFIDENVQMQNLMERLTELIAIGDAYVILKGGTGTLVEISVALEFMFKKTMKEKRLIFYTSFWKPVIDTLKSDSLSLTYLIKRNVCYFKLQEELKGRLKGV